MSLKTKVPFFSLSKQSSSLKTEVLAAIENIIDNTDYVLGNDLVAFEKAFASYCESKYMMGVSNGTAALYLALKALGVVAGDEVIIPAATFSATALAISQLGGTPVFADIDPQTWTLDPKGIEQKITNKTKAIIVVHLYGNPCDMSSILALSKTYNIPVIEDAAQAHGAIYQNQKVGSFGAMSCFSFYPSKNLGSMGDAGAVVFQEEKYKEALYAYRNCGKNDKGEHEYLGFNYRMTSIQAAVLKVKLPKLNEWNKRRQGIAKRYRDEIKNEKLEFQKVQAASDSVYHLFVVKADSRESFTSYLKQEGIGFSFHYKEPVHLQAAYRFLNIPVGSLPISEDLYKRCVSIPIYPEMSSEDCNRVIEVMNNY